MYELVPKIKITDLRTTSSPNPPSSCPSKSRISYSRVSTS